MDLFRNRYVLLMWGGAQPPISLVLCFLAWSCLSLQRLQLCLCVQRSLLGQEVLDVLIDFREQITELRLPLPELCEELISGQSPLCRGPGLT